MPCPASKGDQIMNQETLLPAQQLPMQNMNGQVDGDGQADGGEGEADGDENEYGATGIDVLEGLEAVRKRPAMYVGDTSSSGLHHLIWEVVDNSVDEAMAGHCDKIDVTIHRDGSCQVVDNGRGIPTDMHESGRPAAEVVFTKLHAGGKFKTGAYVMSGGLHGVGISVVNALSEKLEAEIRRNGSIYKLSFSDGGMLAKPMQQAGRDDTSYQDYDDDPQGPMSAPTGTSVRFWPDPEIFEDTAFKAQTVKERLRIMSFLNKGLQIRFRDLRVPSRMAAHLEATDGMEDYLEDDLELDGLDQEFMSDDISETAEADTLAV